MNFWNSVKGAGGAMAGRGALVRLWRLSASEYLCVVVTGLGGNEGFLKFRESAEVGVTEEGVSEVALFCSLHAEVPACRGSEQSVLASWRPELEAVWRPELAAPPGRGDCP